MQVLKGGIILLNLCTLSLVLDGSTQSITDKETLKQLSELQMYINSDTTKKPTIGYKPVAVQYYSEENGFSGTMLCTLMSEGTDILIIGYDGRITLSIYCGFTYNQEEIPMTPYVLDSAEVQSSLGVYSEDNSQFGGDLKVIGTVKVGDDLQVDGTITKKVGSSYVEIPTKTIYQHVIKIIGDNTLFIKIICNVAEPLTDVNDLIALINELFNDQGHSSSNPMNIDVTGVIFVNTTVNNVLNITFNGSTCTYDVIDDSNVTDILTESSMLQYCTNVTEFKDTVYRLN